MLERKREKGKSCKRKKKKYRAKKSGIPFLSPALWGALCTVRLPERKKQKFPRNKREEGDEEKEETKKNT